MHAVELGRRVYAKVVSYLRYRMTPLLGLTFLFLGATAVNVNDGVALDPSTVLFLLFVVTAAGVVIIAVVGTVFDALTNRRDPTSGLTPPVLEAAAIALVPVAMIVLATELPVLRGALLTQRLTGASGWHPSGCRCCCPSSSRPASGYGDGRRARATPPQHPPGCANRQIEAGRHPYTRARNEPKLGVTA